MPQDFQAKKQDEYFIAISNQGIGKMYHSFIMLGVVVNGQPQLLTRVGKSIRAGDNSLLLPGKSVLGYLQDEKITRDPEHQQDINYCAYALNYTQVVSFLGLLDQINSQQILDLEQRDKGFYAIQQKQVPDDAHLSKLALGDFNKGYVRVKNKTHNQLFYVDKRSGDVIELPLSPQALETYDALVKAPVKLDQNTLDQIKELADMGYHARHEKNKHVQDTDQQWYSKYKTIFSYKPILETEEGEVTFHYTYKPISAQNIPQVLQQQYKRTQEFTYSNTCRHTAVELLDQARQIEKTPEHVSKKFFSKLPLKMRLTGGKISSDTPLYILPLPPQAYQSNDGGVSAQKKQEVLSKLYLRMNKLITLNPESRATWDKFQLLKRLYIEQSGNNNASPLTILQSIQKWSADDKKKLFATRGVGGFFTWKSATKKLFDEFSKESEKPKPRKK